MGRTSGARNTHSVATVVERTGHRAEVDQACRGAMETKHEEGEEDEYDEDDERPLCKVS